MIQRGDCDYDLVEGGNGRTGCSRHVIEPSGEARFRSQRGVFLRHELAPNSKSFVAPNFWEDKRSIQDEGGKVLEIPVPFQYRTT